MIGINRCLFLNGTQTNLSFFNALLTDDFKITSSSIMFYYLPKTTVTSKLANSILTGQVKCAIVYSQNMKLSAKM